MTGVLLRLPPHLRSRLACALDAGLLAPPITVASMRAVLGLREGGAEVVQALIELERQGLSGRALAICLRAIEQAAVHAPRPDLVWSGPAVPGLHARDTRRVFDELLGEANRSLWVATFAYFDGPRAFEVLARRMDENAALEVALLLNIQRRKGDTSGSQDLVRQFASRFWSTDWPGQARPMVFYDPRSLDPDGPAGVLHAKAVVVDEEVLFMTSANLTEAALDRNIELGLLVRDPALALSVVTHFQALISRGLLQPLPTPIQK